MLAWGPLVAAVACSVYDDTLVGGAAALGGSGVGAGASSAGSGASASSGASGGSETGGTSSGTAGKVGDGGEGAVASSGGGGSSGASVVGGGGSGGGAGSNMTGAGGEPATEPSGLIDDMEDGDAQITLEDGRNGYWYVGGDDTPGASTEPELKMPFQMTALSAERSNYAARIKAVGFSGWGSVIGFNFVELAGSVKPYDASAFCAVELWAKAASATTVRFRAPDVNTHQAGGVCTVGGGAGKDCYDHFVSSISLGTTWKRFEIKLSTLQQAGTGYHPADGKLRTNALMALEWGLPGSGNTYEIWIDDVKFLACP
jgi:hypothetical protein